jgi:hypothetical protein
LIRAIPTPLVSIKKPAEVEPGRLFVFPWKKGDLFGDDRFSGANRLASAAIDTEVRIDFIRAAFGDCSLGTFVFACAASGAFVGNFVSHSSRYLAHDGRFG